MVILVAFGLLGYLRYRSNCEPAPRLMAFIIGPMLEENFRRAMMVGRGDRAVFITKPIRALFLATAVLLVITTLLPAICKRREEAFVEGDKAFRQDKARS